METTHEVNDELQTFTAVFSHATRIRLLTFLAASPAAWTEAMAQELQVPRNTLGRHLRILESHNLIWCDIPADQRARRAGRWTVDNDRLRAVLAAFDDVRPKF